MMPVVYRQLHGISYLTGNALSLSYSYLPGVHFLSAHHYLTYANKFFLFRAYNTQLSPQS